MTGFTNIGKASGFAGIASDGSPEGDLTGSYPNPLVVGIWDNPVDPRVPSNGDTLIFNGGEWIPTPAPTATTCFQGIWNANANSPDIANFPGLSDGFVWIVSVAGNTSVGGITGWIVGDYAVYSGGNWYKLSNSSFGWGLTGNNGTNPTVNYVGTADAHDMVIRANASERIRAYWTGGTRIEGNLLVSNDLQVTNNVTGSNAKLTGDLAVCGGDITTNSAVFNLLNGATTRINMGNSAACNWISGSTKFPQGISGSLTRLPDGTSAFIGDVGVIVTSASNGAVTFKIDDSKFASLTGSVFTGPVSFNTGLSGSLTNLVDGTSYIIAGANATVTSASNGAITIAAIPNGADTHVQFNDGGFFRGDSGLTYNKTTDTLTIAGDLAVNGGDITTTSTTFNLVNSAATTVNFAGSATHVEVGAATGTTSINNDLTVDGNTTLGNAATDTTTVAGSLAVNGTSGAGTNKITSTQASFNLLNDTVTTLNIGGAATTVEIGATAGTTSVNNDLAVDGSTTLGNNIADNTIITGDLAVNGGDITTTSTTFNFINATATTVNVAGGATTGVNVGNVLGTNTVSGTSKFPQGVSGSLTNLADGTSYIIAGSNISVLSSSNGAVTIGNTANVTAVSPLSSTGGPSAQISLTGIVPIANGGTGLSSAGGVANRVLYTANGTSYSVAQVPNAALTNSSLTVTAGTGLTGGGLVSLGGTTTISMPNVGTPGTYGSASVVPVLTTDTQGRVSNVVNTSIAINASQVVAGTFPSTVSVQNIYQNVTSQVSGGSNPLAYGEVIYFTTSGGSAASPPVDRASAASASTAATTIGLVSSTTIPNGTAGQIITRGVLVGNPLGTPPYLNTNGFTQGDLLYVDPTTPGVLTNVRPSYPNFAIPVGIVIVKNQYTGAIYVDPSVGYNAADIVKIPAPSTKRTESAPGTTSILSTWFNGPPAISYLALDFNGGGNVTLSAGPIQAQTTADYGRILWIHNISTKTVTFNAGGTTYLSGGVALVLQPNSLVQFMWSFVGGGQGRWLQMGAPITVS